MNKIPLHLILGQILSHFPWEVIEPVKGAGVEESISRFPEHSRHLVVVVGHQLGFGRFLGKSKQAMDVFNSLECFLKKQKQYTNMSNNIIFTSTMFHTFNYMEDTKGLQKIFSFSTSHTLYIVYYCWLFSKAFLNMFFTITFLVD